MSQRIESARSGDATVHAHAGDAAMCPGCGARCTSQQRYCDQCGQPLSQSGSPAATGMLAPALQEELKFLSVLFVDVCNSTAHVSGASPEEARAYLDQGLSFMTRSVENYGGTVSQLLGDGLLALFGAPIAQEDHALRACMAAAAMQTAARAHTVREPLAPLVLRIGIHSGQAVVGLMGQFGWSQYRADGDTIHVASRLEKEAAPGSVWLGAVTQRLVAEQLDTRELAAHSFRGVPGSMSVFELVIDAEGSSAAPLTRRRRWAPLIGRDAALDKLAGLAQTAREGTLRVIGLRGEAGIGKSRLISEWCASPGVVDFQVCTTHARGYASVSSYIVVADLVRSLLGLQRTGAPAERAAAHTLLADWPEEGADHLPALRDLLELTGANDPWRALNPAQRRRRIGEALHWLILRRLADGPLLLVLEDIFLADRESQRLLEWLVPRLDGTRLLICVSYRQDFEHRWAESSWFAEHWLAPLRESDMTALAGAMLGTDAALLELVHELVERADGNPFFLEQIVITLIDEGSLIGTPGDYRLGGAPCELRVPGSIAAVIGARVDRLPAAAKAMLEAACVLSDPITPELIAAMQECDVAEVAQSLRLGVAAGLLTGAPADAAADAQAPPVTVPMFRHALVQEVLLGALTRGRRKALHRRAFLALKAQHGSDDCEIAPTLTRHALRGELWADAAHFAVKSMARAVSRSANREALRLLDTGIDASRRVADPRQAKSLEMGLLLEAIGALMALGHIDTIFHNLERAEAIATELGDQRCLAAVSLQMAVFLWMRGSYTEGLVRATQALEAGRLAQRRKLQMAALQTRLMMFHGLGRYAEAATEACLVRRDFQAELAENRLLPGWATKPAVNLHSFYGSTLWRLGDYAGAQAELDRGYHELAEFDHPYSRGPIDFVQAQMWIELGRLAEAEALMRDGVAAYAQHDVPTLAPCSIAMLGTALARGDKAGEAVQLLEQAFARRVFAAGGSYGEFFMWLSLGVAKRAFGELSQAIDCCTRAVALAREGQQYGHSVEAMYELADSLRAAGECARAHDSLADALAQAQRSQMTVWIVRCHAALAQITETAPS